jgi:hypothetical protein
MFLDDDGSAEYVSGSGGQTQKKTKQDGMHVPKDDNSSRFLVLRWRPENIAGSYESTAVGHGIDDLAG